MKTRKIILKRRTVLLKTLGFGLVTLLLLSPFFCLAQTTNDQQRIIQNCLNIESIQIFYSQSQKKGDEPVFIRQNSIVPENLEVLKFGKKVEIWSDERLFFHDVKEFVEFNKLEISSNKAVAIFSIKGYIVKANLELINDVWEVKSKSIEKIK
jgi:hypothetical protein